LAELNKQVSEDANNLANALKGDNKLQGNWGETQLEAILERSGLLKGINWHKQEVFEDEAGQKKQPDYIIKMPEDKSLIIDSKVSLVAYERYYNAQDEEEKKKYLKEHVESVVGHVKGLGKKNYQDLYQINQPDYVLMFVPIEHALSLVIQENPRIKDDAEKQQIFFVTGAMLIPTLKLISYIWKQEKQKTNVLEIAKQGGLMYDKFVAFVEDLKTVGTSIEKAKDAHHEAMKKLVSSPKKADTLVKRAEKMKELGASTTKQISQEILDEARFNEEQE